MEPRFNEVAGDRPNLFVKWRVRYIEVLFHTFYCNFGRDIEIISFVISRTSLNRGSLNRGSTVEGSLGYFPGEYFRVLSPTYLSIEFNHLGMDHSCSLLATFSSVGVLPF